MKFMMRIFRKLWRIFSAFFALDGKTLGNEIAMPCRRLSKKLTARINRAKYGKTLRTAISGKSIVIFPPTIDWHMPLFQRPQQLAQAYARREDICVIYISPNIKEDQLAFEVIADGSLYVIGAECFRIISPVISYASRVILSISWAPNIVYSERLKYDYLIYEYIDELEIFDGYSDEFVADHKKLLRKADVTVATAVKLYNQIKDISNNPVYSTNGCDYDHFASTRQIQPHPSLVDITKGYDCVLGYYGALATWFDYDLVAEVAQKRPNWVWLLIGMDYDGTIGSSGVLRLSNVVFLGTRQYRDLPEYLTVFDIATIPFKINEITLSTSPVKLFEYMAGAKPILTSRMPECLRYKSVYTYKDSEDFIDMAEKLAVLGSDEQYMALLEKEALDNTWDAKSVEILRALPSK